jgi:hypothetical protein
VILALLFTLCAIVIVSVLSIVSAKSVESASPNVREVPLVITAAVMFTLAIEIAMVIASKHRLNTVLETSTEATPLIHTVWFCRHCGAQIQYSDQYCDRCGVSNVGK